MPDELRSGADIIDIYTRRQAIEDGVLVQLSGPGYQGDPWVPAMVAEAGFRYPVAMTATAFCRVRRPPGRRRRETGPLPRHQGPPVGRAVDAQGGNSAHPNPGKGDSPIFADTKIGTVPIQAPAAILHFSLRVVPTVPEDY